MIRSRPRHLLLGALLVALAGALAPTGCEVRQGVYGLTLDSSLVSGCFPPLACPVVLAESVSGTFRLTAAPFAAPYSSEPCWHLRPCSMARSQALRSRPPP